MIEAVLETYRTERHNLGSGTQQRAETFMETLRRVGIDPFKAAANSARIPSAEAATV